LRNVRISRTYYTYSNRCNNGLTVGAVRRMGLPMRVKIVPGKFPSITNFIYKKLNFPQIYCIIYIERKKEKGVKK
jgi:hypothetical protein